MTASDLLLARHRTLLTEKRKTVSPDDDQFFTRRATHRARRCAGSAQQRPHVAKSPARNESDRKRPDSITHEPRNSVAMNTHRESRGATHTRQLCAPTQVRAGHSATPSLATH